MCLILFAINAHPAYPFVLAANRDEFYDRPAVPAGFWPEAPHLLAGRDLRGGGTWLGITRQGRFGAVTNYREPHGDDLIARSRGSLPTDFLTGAMEEEEYRDFLRREGNAWRGYNLLFGTPREIWYYSNRGEALSPVPTGVHGLSNRLLDTPWPKVEGGRRALSELLAREESLTPESLLSLLMDRVHPPDSFLPDTGVGIDLERLLSPRFIVTPNYGTRSSTVVLVDRDGEVSFTERTWSRGEEDGTVSFGFRITG